MLLFAHEPLTAAGAHPDDAAKVAGSLIDGNLTGNDSHGVIQLSGYIERIEAQCAAVKNARPATGVEEILLPGDAEYRARAERLVTGIPIAEATVADIARVCGQYGVEMVSPM